MPRLKRVNSEDSIGAPWIETAPPSHQADCFSPGEKSKATLTRTGKAQESRAAAINRTESSASSCVGVQAGSGGAEEGPASLEAVMRFQGHRVKVKSTATHVSWKAVNTAVGCCVDRRKLARRVPFDEVLSAMALNKQAGCCYARDHSFVIYTFSRPLSGDPNTWRPEEYVLTAASGEAVREWVALINGRLQALRDRPRNLLVYVNPFSGARRARHIWERVAAPVFQRARVEVTVVDTAKMDHAKEMVECMKAEELAGYGGVVAVGGDGLFQEVVAGLLARRARGDVTAHRIRVGHIPAGSTDAVAYTLHGSRCAATAALHIALGDRLSLDAGRMAAADGTVRHFVCQAGYGFMGDVMRFSERLRFMGPVRYDVTGALQVVRGASYRVALAYREATSTTADVQQLCTTQCEVCRLAGIRMQGPHGAYHRSATTSCLPGGGAHATAATTTATSGAGAVPGTPLGGASPHALPPGMPGGIGGGHSHGHGMVSSASAGAVALGGAQQPSRYTPPQGPLPVSSGGLAGPGGASGTATADATPAQPGTPVHGPAHGPSAVAAQAWQAQAMGLFTSATAGWFTPYSHTSAPPGGGGGGGGGAGAGAGNGSAHSTSFHGVSGGDAAAGGLGPPPPALTTAAVAAPVGAASGGLATGGSGAGGGGGGGGGQGLLRAPSAPLQLQHLAAPSSQENSGPLHTTPAHAGTPAGGAAGSYHGAGFLRSGGGGGSACGGSPRAPSSLTGYATGMAAAAVPPEPLQPPSLSSHSVPIAATAGAGSAAGTPSGAAAAATASQPLYKGLPPSGPGGGGAADAGGGAGGLCTAPVVDAEGWTHVEGEFASIMCVVTPCRSDKSKRGIIPNGHLSDGRMYLVLVSKCAHPNFLRFLIRLSARGLVDRCLPHVRVVPITALRVSPLPGGHYLGGCLWDAGAPQSAWNVDGELLHCADVNVNVLRGAVEVFARGPETPAAARQHR